MRDIYKQPIFYYILVPTVIGLWLLWLATIGLPAVKDKFEREKDRYIKAEKLIAQILELDPQRLDYAKAKKSGSGFDYTTAIDQVTRLCKISPAGYKLSSSPVRKMKGGQKSQDATMAIDAIDVEKFARFLSLMHLRWQNLQCTNAAMTKQKGTKDVWKVDIRFKYYQ